MKKEKVLEFLREQEVFVLSTMDADGAPEMRALINIRNPKIAPHLVKFFKKDDRILIITNTHSDKISQIRANSVASLYSYNQKFEGLLLKGYIKEVLDEETSVALWDDSWKMYYPGGRDGGDFSILEFVPETYKSYSGFEKEKGEIKG